MRGRARVQLACAALAVAALVGLPLGGVPVLIRLPAVLAPMLVIAFLAARPWRWTKWDYDAIAAFTPSTTAIAVTAILSGALLAWIVVTRFQSGDINAIDFTVYFDRPLYQTAHGRALFVETSDVPAFSQRSQFAVHAHYILLLVALFYRIVATPYWLLALSVVAVVLGAVHTFRILRHLGAPDIVASAAALAFLLNANTARTLMYGFHPEVLYAWFIPAALDAGLRQNRRWFVTAVVCCACVKEDAVMALFAVSAALALAGAARTRDSWIYLAAPTAIGFANLALYYAFVLPIFASSSTPVYAAFWMNHGPTPARALWHITTHPVDAARAVVTSGFVRVLMPHALLPLAAWRWVVGILPIVVVYASSGNSQLREFGLYYSIILVPFLTIGSAIGALAIARALLEDESSARIASALVIFLAALLVYGDRGGYSMTPWRPEVAATPRLIDSLASEPVVLVQSALYAHAGYDARIVLLTRETLSDPKYAGAVTVLAPKLTAYPFDRGELDALTGGAQSVGALGGITIVRRP